MRSGERTKSTSPVATAFFGISSNWAVCGSCAMASPPAPRTALTPRVPSEPAPEKRMQIARSCRSSAKERKKKSTGIRMPSCVTGLDRERTPSRIDRY